MASLRDVIFNALYAQPAKQPGENHREYHERQVDAILKVMDESGRVVVFDANLDTARRLAKRINECLDETRG